MIPKGKNIVDAFHHLCYDAPAGQRRVHHRTTWMGTLWFPFSSLR